MSHLVQIGNSLGVRIPKLLIEQAKLNDTELVLKVVSDGILVSPVHKKVRKGWAQACESASSKEKLLIDDSIRNTFDQDEWEW